MATKKIRMRPEGINDYADVLHPETTASQVIEETNKRFLTDAERTKIEQAITSVPSTTHLMPISGGVLENYSEKIVTLSGTTVNIPLSTSNNFYHTITGATTYSIVDQLPAGVYSFTLIIKQPNPAQPITFSIAMRGSMDTVPDVTKENREHILTFISTNAGLTWSCIYGGWF